MTRKPKSVSLHWKSRKQRARNAEETVYLPARPKRDASGYTGVGLCSHCQGLPEPSGRKDCETEGSPSASPTRSEEGPHPLQGCLLCLYLSPKQRPFKFVLSSPPHHRPPFFLLSILSLCLLLHAPLLCPSSHLLGPRFYSSSMLMSPVLGLRPWDTRTDCGQTWKEEGTNTLQGYPWPAGRELVDKCPIFFPWSSAGFLRGKQQDHAPGGLQGD